MARIPAFTREIPQPVWLVLFLIDLVLSAGLAYYGLSVYQMTEQTQRTTELNLRLTCSNAEYIQHRVIPECTNILKENR